MKTTIWKTLIALLLTLLLLCAVPALGEARFPAVGGVVTDDANVLSLSMAKDIAAYAQKLESDVSVKVRVAVVQFLDGETAQTYADTLFTRWELDEDSVLLVGAAAEDTFAAASGDKVRQKISDGSLNSLLYSSGFADAFQAQRYDEAFGKLMVGFNSLAAKQYGKTVELGGLFAAYQTQTAQAQSGTVGDAVSSALQSAADAASVAANSAGSAIAGAVNTVVNTTSQLWSSTVNSIDSSAKQYQDQNRDENGRGLTPGGWIVLAILVMIVVGQSGPARRARRWGCGCSPLGWIFSGLGLGALFGWHRDDREAERDRQRDWRNDARQKARDWRNDLRQEARDARRDEYWHKRDRYRD